MDHPDAGATGADRAAYGTNKSATVTPCLAREGSLAERIVWNTLLQLLRLLPIATSPRAAVRKLAAVLAGSRVPFGSYLDRGPPGSGPERWIETGPPARH